MDYTGFIPKYKINRPLTDEERALELVQKKRLEVAPIYQSAVIRMNGTFLETTDKFYSWVGFLTLGMAVTGLVMLGTIFGFLFILFVEKWAEHSGREFMFDALFVGGAMCMFLPLLAVCIWGFRIEAFRYTHYPIRFNRKTRMVHAFRFDGTVLSAPWDDLFFTLGRGNRANFVQNWDVRAHVLDKDGVTVRETFALGDHQEDQDLMRRFWEFHRRYMEEGPQSVAPIVEVFMPISEQRETFMFGLHRWWAHLEPSRVAYYLFAPIIPFIAVGRWIAMRTSKVPVWPAAIEAQCIVEPSDPYQRDASNNPADMFVRKPLRE